MILNNIINYSFCVILLFLLLRTNFSSMKQYCFYTFLFIVLASCGRTKKTTDYSFLYENEDSLKLTIDSLEIEKTSVTEIIYNNLIYQSKIHTVLLHPYGFELGEPILNLQKTDTLLLSYDELDTDYKNYYLTIFLSIGCEYFLSINTVIVLFGLSLTTTPVNIFLGINFSF